MPRRRAALQRSLRHDRLSRSRVSEDQTFLYNSELTPVRLSEVARGGFTTKLHAKSDTSGDIIAFAFAGGKASDARDGIPKQQKVYPHNFSLVFPIAGRGRPRKRHIPDQLSALAEDVSPRKLGLDHFEGRPWHGLHRHALMTLLVAPICKPGVSLKRAREKRIPKGPPQPTLAATRRAVVSTLARAPPY